MTDAHSLSPLQEAVDSMDTPEIKRARRANHSGHPTGHPMYMSRHEWGGAGKGNEWSSEDLRLLRELAGAGTPVKIIATTLSRTPSAVKNKAGMQGISLRPRR